MVPVCSVLVHRELVGEAFAGLDRTLANTGDTVHVLRSCRGEKRNHNEKMVHTILENSVPVLIM